MEIKEIKNAQEKLNISRSILEDLTFWFEIEESREEYIKNSADKTFFSAFINEKPIGFIYLNETSKNTVEIAVIGVLKEYHHKGIGKELFKKAKKETKNKGYSFIQVKTVKPGIYKEYDDTNMFYKALGFKELEIFPTLWNENNPCLIYVMAL